jgi:hypothetical protein
MIPFCFSELGFAWEATHDTYFHLPKCFYSLIQVLLLLGYMALARIKTI